MSSAENDTRPVWLTREQRDRLWSIRPEIAQAWDAAPADPAEAVRKTLQGGRFTDGRTTSDRAARAVLAALGAPDRV